LVFAFRDSISEVDCYIGAYSGIGHCLLAQTIGNLFSMVLRSRAYCGFLAIGSLSPGRIVFLHPIFAQLEAGISSCPLLCGMAVMQILTLEKSPME
jgi:hypothetical protein